MLETIQDSRFKIQDSRGLSSGAVAGGLSPLNHSTTQPPADAAIIAEARSWLDTRWVHGQAVKGHGTDCVGFIIRIGKTFAWIPEDYIPPVYSCQHALHRDTSLLLEELAKFAVSIDIRQTAIAVGDILAFQYERTAGHAGIYIGDGRFVHAYMLARRVKEASLKDFHRYLNSVWRPKKQLIAHSKEAHSKEAPPATAPEDRHSSKEVLTAISYELRANSLQLTAYSYFARTIGAPCK